MRIGKQIRYKKRKESSKWGYQGIATITPFILSGIWYSKIYNIASKEFLNFFKKL